MFPDGFTPDWDNESYSDQATPADSTTRIDLRYLRWQFERRYMAPILSRFRWFGYPTQIDSPQIEQALIYHGAICGIKRYSMPRPEIFPVRLSGMNDYGKPTIVQPITYAGADIPLSTIEVDPMTGMPFMVWEYENDLHLVGGLGSNGARPLTRFIDFWHDRLAQAFASVIIADYNARAARVYVGTEEMQEVFRDIQRDLLNGHFVFIVDEQLDLISRLQALNVAPDSQARISAWDNFYRTLHEYLSFVGIPFNAEAGKQSGVSPYEIAMNHEYQSAFVETEYYRRLKFTEKYNNMMWRFLLPDGMTEKDVPQEVNPQTMRPFTLRDFATPLEVLLL